MHNDSLKKFHSKFMISIIGVVSIIIISPPLFNNANIKLLCQLLMLIWIFKALLRRPFAFFHPTKGVFAVYILIFISVFRYFIDTSAFYNQQYTSIYIYCFFVIVFSTVKNYEELNCYKPILWLLLLIIPIWTIISIQEGLMDPYLFRHLSGSGLADNSYFSSKGVVGYDFIYASVPMITILFGLLFSKAIKKWQMLILLINLISALFLLYIANYGIAFFAMLISLIVFFSARMKMKTNQELIIFCSLLFCLSMSVILYYKEILEWLMRIFANTYYIVKLNSIYEYAIVGNEFGRMETYLSSLKAFINNPLFGIGFNSAYIGMHSVILDKFAELGFFGGLATVVVLLNVFQKKIFKHSGLAFRTNAAVLIANLIIFTFNPMGTVISVIIYAIFAVAQIYLTNESVKVRVENK